MLIPVSYSESKKTHSIIMQIAEVRCSSINKPMAGQDKKKQLAITLNKAMILSATIQ